jgi:hypothetical protein
MDQVPSYFQWGILQISVPNLVVIGLMVLVFALALVIPYPYVRSEPAKSKGVRS